LHREDREGEGTSIPDLKRGKKRHPDGKSDRMGRLKPQTLVVRGPCSANPAGARSLEP